MSELPELFKLQSVAMDKIASGVVITDAKQPGNPIIYTNAAICKLTGYEEGELIGNSLRCLQGPKSDKRTIAQMRQAIHKGQPFEGELVNYDRTGRSFWNKVSINPVKDRLGDVCYFVGLQDDVTEEKRIQDSLSQQQQQVHLMQSRLRRLDRLASLGTVSAGIVHEMNNPLCAALAASDAAQETLDRSQAPPAFFEYLDAIDTPLLRCREIMRNMLRFSNEEALEKALHSVNDVVDRALRMTAHYAKVKDVAVRSELAQGISRAFINGLAIEQVLVNLIRNAIEASGTTTLFVSTDLCAEGVRVTVRDNGDGIADEDLQRIFDPLVTIEKEGTGTGLGLFISRAIIVEHRGSIEVESRSGRGTTFVVTLPIDVLDEASEQVG